MNLIKLSLMAFFCLVSFSVQAQNVKPKFKKFQFVTYRPSGKGDEKLIRVEVAMEINNDGMMHRVFNIFYDYFSSNLTYAGMLGGDTTYRVPDTLILKLNKIFIDNKNMIQQTEFNKTPSKTKFHGPYAFISYTTDQGDVKNLILVYYKNVELRYTLAQLLRMGSRANRASGQVFRDPSLEATILKYHNSCKDLPEMVPINPADMEVADPSVKH